MSWLQPPGAGNQPLFLQQGAARPRWWACAVTGWLRSGCGRCAAQRHITSAQHGAAEAGTWAWGREAMQGSAWSPMRAAKLVWLPLRPSWGRTRRLAASGVACYMFPCARAPLAGHAPDAASGWDILVHGAVLAAGPRPFRVCLHAAVDCRTGMRATAVSGAQLMFTRGR